jgi:hypothetical protein
MADDSTTTDAAPAALPLGPSDQQEQEVNKQLFGNKPPNQAAPDQPHKPESEEKGDPMLQEGMKIYAADRQRADESNATYEQLHNQIQEINKRLQNEPTPQVPTPRPYPAQPDPQQQKQNVGQIFGNIMALVAIGSAVFGKHRGPYGSAIAMSGAGAFLNAFSKARNQEGKEALQYWNKSVELTSKQNAEDTRTYNEILANKRLDMTQQMDLLRTVAAQRQDSAMYTAAANKDLNNVMKVMSNKLKAQVAFAKSQQNVNKTAMDNWMSKTGQGRTWAAWVESKTGIDPHKDYESFLKANKEYPASKWIDEHTKKQDGTPGEESEKLSPGTKKTSSGQTLATDTPLSPQQARSMLKPGDWFEGTNGKFYQIPPQ